MKSRRRNASEDDTAVSRAKIATQNSESIPTDVIIDILSRLPARSIARCRCVSKTWASMLRLPCFTELFFTRSRARPQLLFTCVKDGNVFFFSAPQVQNLNENSCPVNVSYHMKFAIDGFPEISAIRGLVCVTHVLGTWREIVPMICNPSTGQSVTLPKMKAKRSGMFAYFWFDHIDKQFKVLYKTCSSDGIDRISEEQVLILGADKLSWRVAEIPADYNHLSDKIYINGVFYYVANVYAYSGMISRSRIARFDVMSRTFRLVKGNEDMPSLGPSNLVNYNGKLAAILSDWSARLMFRGITRENRSFEMFVLEDPAKEEWSRQVYKFPPMWQSIAPEDELYFVGVVGTNEFVLSPRNVSVPFYLFYYNIERKTIRRVEIQGMDAFKNCRVHISVDHVENVNPME